MAKSTQAVIKFISKLGLLLAALDTQKANKLIADIELLIGQLTND